jgi:hypothetical protein
MTVRLPATLLGEILRMYGRDMLRYDTELRSWIALKSIHESGMAG